MVISDGHTHAYASLVFNEDAAPAWVSNAILTICESLTTTTPISLWGMPLQRVLVNAVLHLW